jgi:hypothetical protein
MLEPIPARKRPPTPEEGLRPNPLWYREAVIYEIRCGHLRTRTATA